MEKTNNKLHHTSCRNLVNFLLVSIAFAATSGQVKEVPSTIHYWSFNSWLMLSTQTSTPGAHMSGLMENIMEDYYHFKKENVL